MQICITAANELKSGEVIFEICAGKRQTFHSLFSSHFPVGLSLILKPSDKNHLCTYLDVMEIVADRNCRLHCVLSSCLCTCLVLHAYGFPAICSKISHILLEAFSIWSFWNNNSNNNSVSHLHWVVTELPLRDENSSFHVNILYVNSECFAWLWKLYRMQREREIHSWYSKYLKLAVNKWAFEWFASRVPCSWRWFQLSLSNVYAHLMRATECRAPA